MKPKKIEFNGKTYYGFKVCPQWLREKLIESRDGKCEDCGSTKDLEIHRRKRGADGGLYMVVPRNHPLHNTQVLCHECHEMRNYSRKLIYKGY